MRAESIYWLADSLGLPSIMECEDGTISWNYIASGIIRKQQWSTFGQAISDLVGYNVDPAMLKRDVSKARNGIPTEYKTDRGHRILLVPVGKGKVCAVIASDTLQSGSYAHRLKNRQLADSQSHELANALGAIVGWSQLAKGGNRVQEALELIETASKTAWSISRKMLGHDEPPACGQIPPIIDLSSFIDDAVRLISLKALQAGITVHRTIEPSMRIMGTRDALWSIVWNPITNAVEAMPNGGVLTVSATGISNMVRLVIQDDGHGMGEEIKRNVFQPYFTTKKEGSGLGLALLKQAVNSLDGTVSIESSFSKGTRITIELPRIVDVQDKNRTDSTNTDRCSGIFATEKIRGRILIVDDDPALREMIATALDLRGAQVVAVATPSEALEVNGLFDLALVDMQLPEQTGDTLLGQLYTVKKVRKGIIVTGDNSSLNGSQDHLKFDLLRKPFQLDDLFERVIEALATIKNEEILAI